jgi:hypothetical protein
MKIDVEIPDTLFRKAKATATKRDVSVEDLLTQALREHMERLADDFSRNQLSAPPWMRAFGGLRALHKETKKINRIMRQEFEQIDVDELQ